MFSEQLFIRTPLVGYLWGCFRLQNGAIVYRVQGMNEKLIVMGVIMRLIDWGLFGKKSKPFSLPFFAQNPGAFGVKINQESA